MADELLGGLLPQAYNADGTPLAADKIGEALQKGEVPRFLKVDPTTGQPTRIPMIAPDGTRWLVPADEVEGALRDPSTPWQLETPEAARARKLEEASEEHPILAGVAAGASEAADVASFGQTGVVRGLVSKGAKAAGAPEVGHMAEDIETLKRVNPGATGIGMVGGALVGGAEGATGKVLKGAAEWAGLGRLIPGLGILETGAVGETGVLTRAGASATKYGVTGAVEGAGFGAGQELARQTIGDKDIAVERILAAAGEGAALGGAFGSLLGGVGRMGGDIGAKTIGKFVDPEVQALRALGGTTKEIKNFIRTRPPEQRKTIINTLLGEEGVIKPGQSLEEAAGNLRAMRESTGKEIGDFLKKIDEIPWHKPDKESILAEIKGLTGELRSRNIGPDVTLARELESGWMPAIEESKSLSDLQAVRRRFDQYKSNVWNREKDVARDAAYKKFSAIVESGVERDVARTIQAATDLGETGIVNDYIKLKGRDQAFIVGDEMIKAAHAGTRAASGVGIGDVVRGGAGFATAAVQGLGALGSLATGVAVDLAWRAAKSRTAAAIMARAFGSLRNGTDSTALKVSNAVGSAMLDGAKSLTQRVPGATAKILTDYQQSSKLAREAKSNLPLATAKVERAVQPLATLDPDLGRKTAVKLHDDLEWLTSKLPPPGTPTIFSTRGLPSVEGGGKRGQGRPKGGSGPVARISTTYAAKFIRSERALSKPITEINRIYKEGRLSPETVEMLRDRRPKLREQMANEAVNKLVEMQADGTVPSHRTRIQMSLATGAPMDSTMDPRFIGSVQAFWQKQRQSAAAPAATPRRETSARMRNRARDRMGPGDAISEGEDVG